MLQLTSSRSSQHIPMAQGALAPVTERIRGEFREMPGLTLTAAQARRLWSLDESTCNEALEQLVGAGFLCRKGDGAYGRVTDLSAHPLRMARASIEHAESSGKAQGLRLKS